uniref:HNH endonuclease signature motif containing protein n=1 Tax=Pseudonocardia sp. TaxID=60912 RepID=UPI002607F88B
AHLARDIATDSVWRRLLVDPASGTLLDYGRTVYRPPAGLADFVRGRDVTCRTPGCRRNAATCELDHVTPWNTGGPTDEANLCTLCTAHHHMKEHPGWQVVLHPDRRVEWITPTGHRYWTQPHDYRE